MNKDQYGIDVPALPRFMRRLDAVCLCRGGGGSYTSAQVAKKISNAGGADLAAAEARYLAADKNAWLAAGETIDPKTGNKVSSARARNATRPGQAGDEYLQEIRQTQGDAAYNDAKTIREKARADLAESSAEYNRLRQETATKYYDGLSVEESAKMRPGVLKQVGKPLPRTQQEEFLRQEAARKAQKKTPARRSIVSAYGL